MRIALGADHAAYELKKYVIERVRDLGYEVVDMGTDSDESCDYPDFAVTVARAVRDGEAERGILMCGTGLGMTYAANKVRGIRAALCCSEYTAEMSRTHNDANVLCLGSRILDRDEAVHIIDIWLKTEFQGGRHARRLDKIARIEEEENTGRNG